MQRSIPEHYQETRTLRRTSRNKMSTRNNCLPSTRMRASLASSSTNQASSLPLPLRSTNSSASIRPPPPSWLARRLPPSPSQASRIFRRMRGHRQFLLQRRAFSRWSNLGWVIVGVHLRREAIIRRPAQARRGMEWDSPHSLRRADSGESMYHLLEWVIGGLYRAKTSGVGPAGELPAQDQRLLCLESRRKLKLFLQYRLSKLDYHE